MRRQGWHSEHSEFINPTPRLILEEENGAEQIEVYCVHSQSQTIGIAVRVSSLVLGFWYAELILREVVEFPA